MITLTHKIVTKEQSKNTSAGMFANKNCNFDAEFYCAANDIERALLSSDSVQSVIDAISNLTDDQILEIDHKTSVSKFIESGDSRETSAAIMSAIFWLMQEDENNAVKIWEDATDEQLLAIYERVTNNGLFDSSDYFWGAAGSDWAARVAEKFDGSSRDAADIKLTWKITDSADFGGWKFTVESGYEFDEHHFAETRGLNLESISVHDIDAVHKAAAQLRAHQWLEVDYEIN